MRWLVVVLVGCSGMTGAREHARFEATWEYCKTHACETAPVVVRRGDGCYVVGGVDYECSFDRYAGKQLRCRASNPWVRAAELRWAKPTADLGGYELASPFGRVVQRDRFEIDTRCWRTEPVIADSVVTTPHCDPTVQIVDSPVEARPHPGVAYADLDVRDVPATMPVTDVTHTEIQRSGKVRLIGDFELCASPDGVIDAWTMRRSTGFPAVDLRIKRLIGGLHATTPPEIDACAVVRVVVNYSMSCG